MLFRLFCLGSWGAFLLLNMPQRKIAVLQVAVLWILGAARIFWKKPVPPKRIPEKWPVTVTVGALLVAGACFYVRWAGSPKIAPIALALHLPAPLLAAAAAVAGSVCAGYAVFYMVQKLYIFLSAPNDKTGIRSGLASCLILACITVMLSQGMIGVQIFSMGLPKFLGGVMLVAVVTVGLYSLLGKPLLGSALGTGLFLFISTVNTYVYRFRGRLFEPVDIFSVGTALNVADNYNLFPVPQGVAMGWILWLAALLALIFALPKRKPGVRQRCLLAIGCIAAAVGVGCCCAVLKPYHWEKEGAVFNGYLLDFGAKVKEAVILPPEGYTAEYVELLADRYTAGGSEKAERRPHVIVIMDEAFADLSVHGQLPVQQQIMPFISSLRENTVKGYALASVFGGNTANSEFEFLTGHSMAWLSENAVPYQQYIRSGAYCMVSCLKGQYGYRCIAMHPYLSGGWNRPAVYGHLGFDEMYFLEDFPRQELIRGYVSDREMFYSVIDMFEARKEEPLFLFGVTMQNHGGYSYSGEDFTPSVTLTGLEKPYPDVRQYLSLLRETDRAVEELIRYFSGVEDDVLIVFFGDHQPKLEEDFFRDLGNEEKTLKDRLKRYLVPFFIWANYDIAEEEGVVTSLNYLSNYVYEAAGIPLPPYNRFLAEMAVHIPAVNSQGFYSKASGGYLTFEEASAEEQRWLADYRALQYNSLWDQDDRSDRLFPLLPAS